MAKKKVVKSATKLPSWWPTGFEPCVAKDPASAIGAPFNRVFMLAPTFEGTLAVQRWANVDSLLGVRDRVIPNHLMKRYTLEEIPLQSALEELKVQMLAEGATPEAVRLVGEHIPLSEKELSIMAAKLTKKTTAPKATKAPKAEKAAKAPKAEKAPKEADTRKIKVLKKDHGARDGSKTAERYDAIIASKTVDEALSNDLIKMADINYAVKQGIVSLG